MVLVFTITKVNYFSVKPILEFGAAVAKASLDD